MRFDLSRPLLQLSPRDYWTISDACEGTQVFGSTGSGKTSGSGQAIAKAMLTAGFGGLVLTAKPDECELWKRYATAAGRIDDVVVFDDRGEHRFNFLEHERSRGSGSAFTENLASLFVTVLAAADEVAAAASQDPFWQRALQQLLRNTVDLLLLARQELSATAMIELIVSAPSDPDERDNERWQRSSYCWECLCLAESQDLDARQRADFGMTMTYWCVELPKLAGSTRSSIVATFTSQVDGIARGALRELFCTTTSITPEATHAGKILIIDLPLKKYANVGRFAQILWKYCWQRVTEAREVDDDTRPVFLWADESQLFLTRHDQSFQTTARSSRACTVYLTQSISNYYTAMSGANPKAAADSFLGVLQTKIFHANGDAETNEWAERTVGRIWKTMAQTSSQEQPVQKPGGSSKTKTVRSTSTSRQIHSELMAREFTVLRKGGPSNGRLVDAIVFQGGRVWKESSTNFLKTTFRQ